MVEGARLESEYGSKAHRGFESLPLRQSLILTTPSGNRVQIAQNFFAMVTPNVLGSPSWPTTRPLLPGWFDRNSKYLVSSAFLTQTKTLRLLSSRYSARKLAML